MPTFADIHSRVALILVAASQAVSDVIPRLVFDAFRRVEDELDLAVCEDELRYVASPGSNILALHYLTDDRLTVRRPFLRTQPRGSRPYLLATTNTVSLLGAESGSLNPFTWINSAADDSSLSVTAQHVSGAADDITVGMSAQFVDPFTGYPGWEVVQRRACAVSALVKMTLSTDITFVVRDSGIPTTISPPLTTGNLYLYGATGDALPLEWMDEPDRRRWYGGTQTAQRPVHVQIVGWEEDGTPQMNIYPTPDAVYEVRVPCLLSQIDSRTSEPATTESTWLTNMGFELLSAMAAADAYRLEMNEERAAYWDAQAARHRRALAVANARMQVLSDVLPMATGVRGPSAPDSPRW